MTCLPSMAAALSSSPSTGNPAECRRSLFVGRRFETHWFRVWRAANTMVFNRAAKTLLQTAAVSDVSVHDWWLYQLISAAGGAIYYDPQPMLQYRQHPDNLFGSNLGWRARLGRIRMMLDGGFRAWNE